MRKYNSYRMPFMACAMTFCVASAFNTNRGLTFRFFPVIVFAPFIVMYNHNIGMYGVHKGIDDILKLMAGEENQSGEEVCEVRRLARDFI